jgi:hypothetical protein
MTPIVEPKTEPDSNSKISDNPITQESNNMKKKNVDNNEEEKEEKEAEQEEEQPSEKINKEEQEETEEPSKKSKKDVEEFQDPSLAKMKDLERLASDPPRIPGLEIITVEPKATLVATKLLDMVISKLSDPKLGENIMDNITKSVELSLENKINKIEYLKKDTEDIENNKDRSKIINDIHNEVLKNKPFQVNVVKGGRQPFFTEEECSFF